MAEATANQKRAIQALSERIFESRSEAVSIAGRILAIDKGFTQEKAKNLIFALRKVDEMNPIDPASLLVGLLTGEPVSMPSVDQWREKHMSSAKEARPNGRVLGPVEGRTWQQWAIEQLGAGRKATVERECPRCHGSGKVHKLPPGQRAFPKRLVYEAIFGRSAVSSAAVPKSLADPPLSRVRHVAGLLDCTLDEASVWIEQLRQAILAESAAASS